MNVLSEALATPRKITNDPHGVRDRRLKTTDLERPGGHLGLSTFLERPGGHLE